MKNRKDWQDRAFVCGLLVTCVCWTCWISFSETETAGVAEIDTDPMEQVETTMEQVKTRTETAMGDMMLTLLTVPTAEEEVYIGIVEDTYDEVAWGFTKHRLLVDVDGEQVEITVDFPTYTVGDEVELEESFWGKYVLKAN